VRSFLTPKVRGSAGPAEPSPDLLDEALSTIAAMLAAAAETVPVRKALADIEQCRVHVADGAGPETLDPLARACLESTRELAAEAAAQGSAQRAHIATMVAAIRDTVSTVAGNEAALQQSLTESAGRFERIATVGTLPQMQALLAAEVLTLRRVTAERHAAWEQTTEQFQERLARLESRLDHTRREAAVDPLTNVANRRAFEEALRDRLQPARPRFVMAMIDADDFKAINDQCGHATGDQVLVSIARTLTGSLRADDLVARIGGDEFVVLVEGLTLRQAESRFMAIARQVRIACQPLVPGGAAPSISIGLAECSAGETADSLQRRADTALYDAKRTGKGRVAVRETPSIRELRETSPRRSRP
jgi:diguanylate cyclase (GGDEF)-like protein